MLDELELLASSLNSCISSCGLIAFSTNGVFGVDEGLDTPLLVLSLTLVCFFVGVFLAVGLPSVFPVEARGLELEVGRDLRVGGRGIETFSVILIFFGGGSAFSSSSSLQINTTLEIYISMIVQHSLFSSCFSF